MIPTRRRWYVGILSLLVVCLLSLGTLGQVDDVDEWLDPYDMLNYDATSKRMRKPAETISYTNVPTKRREFKNIEESTSMPKCPDDTEYKSKFSQLQREFEEHKMRVTSSSTQTPSCLPVFKRFLSKLLKQTEKLGLPNNSKTVMDYDAHIKLSQQAVTEIQKLLKGEESWRTGALDEALSQILFDVKLHEYEAWKWHFEDTFGVEIHTVMKVSFCVLMIVFIICTETWSIVSWFVQFKRLFAICFVISLVWNWLYLYKIAFAEHQNNIVKMESVNEKCTGLKKIDWSDNLKEWFRSTLTLQDDPCKKYYEVLMVNPILLVPPIKAVSVTITTLITEPLKHLGQGISEFLRALLKDLPVTLQLPVLFTIVASIVVFAYGSAQATIHAVLRPLRGGQQDPPPPPAYLPPPAQPPQPAYLPPPAQLPLPIRPRNGGWEPDPHGGGDAHGNPPPLRRRAIYGGERSHVRQRRPDHTREEPPRLPVETLQHVAADNPISEDEIDAEGRGQAEGHQPAEQVQPLEEEPPANEEMLNRTSTPVANKREPRHSKIENDEDCVQRECKTGARESGQPTEAQTSAPATASNEAPSDAEGAASHTRYAETIGVPVQETAQLS